MIDKNGKESIEETVIDDKGRPLKKVKTRQFVDKDGHTVVEEETVDAKGRKIKVQRK